jgi:dTDP-4-dehydrorhamnose reductase
VDIIKKYLVIGNGWVGSKMIQCLINRGYHVNYLSHKDVFKKYQREVNSSYDFIINCAGYTGDPNVDACELNKQDTINGNTIFPIRLCHRCKELGVKLAHFSSGCIYEGNIRDVYDEPNFFGSIYSISKGISDTYLKNKALVFRIRLPFDGTNHHKNLLNKIYHYANNGKLIDGGPNSMSNIDEAVNVACNLIEKGNIGTYNLVNKGSVTTKDIVNMMNMNAEWYNKEDFEKITIAKRSNCIIPEYEEMSDVATSLRKSVEQFQTKLRMVY